MQFTAKAYYDEAEKAPITDGKCTWSVRDLGGNGKDFATIDKKGKLTITDKVNKSTTLLVDCTFETKYGGVIGGYYEIEVAPTNEKTLGVRSSRSGLLTTANPSIREPGESETLRPVWVDNNGQIVMKEDLSEPETVEGVSYKVSGSACSFDPATGELTFKKPGTTKITVTATLDGKKQSFTYTFRCEYLTRKTEIQNKPADGGVITVVGGKSLSLKAVNWNDEAKTTKATDQSIWWDLNSYRYADINWKTGKLTTDKVSQATEVTVYAECDGETAGYVGYDTVKILIVPEKTQYRSYAEASNNGYLYLTGEDKTLKLDYVFEYWVESYGLDTKSRVTDVISSNPKIAEVVKEDGVVTGIKIPKDAKPGKVTITIKGQVLAGKEMVDDKEVDIWKDAPSVKLTINAVKPVTFIEITRPTNRDGSLVPLYVGKSLKLSATINSDATNKKLNWHVGYDPYSDYLDEYEKTTIKNGVLKIDNSWYTESDTYYVWAESEDGFMKSDALEIQAYAMTGAINIVSNGDWPNAERYVGHLNNRTVTIKQGESLEFRALVKDVNGYEGANPDVNWSISGNRGYVEYKESFDGSLDTLKVTGKNPGTVTIKAAAKDGSKKTATFKLVVKPHTLSAPKLETDELYRSCSMTAPSIAYNYTEGDEDITWLNPTDVEFTSDYSKVKITYDKAGGKWRISVDYDAKLGKVVTITVKDVRTDIEEIDRAQPLSMKFTILNPQP